MTSETEKDEAEQATGEENQEGAPDNLQDSQGGGQMIGWKVCESGRIRYQTLEKLSIPELLRLITGVNRCAKRVLSRLEALSELKEFSIESLVERTGITVRQAERILAGCELGRRLSRTSQVNGEFIRDPQPVYELMRDRQGRQEIFSVILLNSKNRIIRVVDVSKGSLNQAVIEAREVFRPAIISSAQACILTHNHPSHDPTPSREDIALTKRLVKIGKEIGITVLDHVIVAGGMFTSMMENGLM